MFGAGTPAPPLRYWIRLREITLCNRVVVSPMDTYSAVDGYSPT